MKKIILPGLILLLVATSGVAFYFYKKASLLKANPNAVAQQEITDLVARVGKIIVLPEGEIPTVATVSDPEKLKDQAFFAKAKSGDKVLLYSNAKKAYLYDPVNNKVLEVAPINLGAEPKQQPIPKTTQNATTTTEGDATKSTKSR